MRKNRGRLSIKLQNEKAIFVMEDTAISPSERLRYWIKVGDEIFLMADWQREVSALARKACSQRTVF